MSDDSAAVPDGRRSWIVAFVGAVAMVFTFGTLFSYGVFLGPFVETFDLSRLVLSSVFSAMLFAFFIGAGAVAVFAARVPARATILLCAAGSGLVAPSLYVTESYAGLLVSFLVLGLVLGMTFIVLASVVPRWFEERRGVATGIIFAGNGLGLFLLPPAWRFAFDRFGVPRGFLGLMLVTTAAFFLAGLTCRRPPWANPSSMTPGEIVEWVADLSRTRRFKLLFVGVALTFAWLHMFAAYVIELFTHRGLTEADASVAYGLIGAVSVLSRLGGGHVADVVGFRRAFLASLGCCAAGIGLLLVPRMSALVAAIALIGLGFGASATLYVPLLMEAYSYEQDTAIVGLSNVAIGIVALAAPPVVIGAIEYTESYTAVLLLTLGTTVGAIWTIAAGTGGS